MTIRRRFWIIFGIAAIVAAALLARPYLDGGTNTNSLSISEYERKLARALRAKTPELIEIRRRVSEVNPTMKIVTLLLINPTNHPLYYPGYPPEHLQPPLALGQIHAEYRALYRNFYGRWDTDHQHMGIGSLGTLSLELPANHAASFDVIDVPDECPLRIELDIAQSDPQGSQTPQTIAINLATPK